MVLEVLPADDDLARSALLIDDELPGIVEGLACFPWGHFPPAAR